MHELPSAFFGILAAFGIFLRLYRRKNDVIQYGKVFHHIHLLEDKSHFIKAQL